jgi:CRISPR-associated endoribonuclease Cas6
MPSVVGIVMRAEGSIAPPSPEQIHALGCSLLDEDHDHRAGLKGFSIRRSQRHDLGWQLDLGLVDDALLPRLERSLNHARGQLHLGRDLLEVAEVGLIARDTWEDLIGTADAVRFIGVRLVSPTFFRRGRNTHLMPFASVVFGHWRRRWEEVHGRAPHSPLDDREIHVARVELRTHDLSYRGRPVTAVTGAVVYDLGDLSEEHRAALHALALLAPYAGCGSRTSAGFGAAEVYLPRSASATWAQTGRRHGR